MRSREEKKQLNKQVKARKRRRNKHEKKRKWKTMPALLKKIRYRLWTDTINLVDEKGRPTGSTRTVDSSTGKMIRNLVAIMDPREMPRGLENFKIMKNLSDAFEHAEEMGKEYFYLDPETYKFLLDKVMKNIPAIWAYNVDAAQAVDDITSAEDYDPNIEIDDEEIMIEDLEDGTGELEPDPGPGPPKTNPG